MFTALSQRERGRIVSHDTQLVGAIPGRNASFKYHSDVPELPSVGTKCRYWGSWETGLVATLSPAHKKAPSL